MVNCPICKGTENDHIFSERREYRGKHYQFGVFYCPRCGVKFTFFTPLEVPEAEEEADVEAAPESPQES